MAFWIVASVATDLVERLRPAGGVRASIAAPRPPDSARDGRHDGRAPGRRRLHLRRDAWCSTGEVERDVKMALGRHDDDRRLRLHLPRRAASVRGPELPRRAQARSRSRGRPAGRHAAPREAHLSGVADRPMTEAAIDARLDARPLRLARRAGRGGARGSCASTSSRSSTGSGAAACVMALGGLLAASDQPLPRASVRARRARRR